MHPSPGGASHGFMGDANAFSPHMWGGSGVPNPHNIGKPPGQGGFDIHSMIPPNLLPGAGQAGGQGPAPPAPPPQGGGMQGLLQQGLGALFPKMSGGMQSPFGPSPPTQGQPAQGGGVNIK